MINLFRYDSKLINSDIIKINKNIVGKPNKNIT